MGSAEIEKFNRNVAWQMVRLPHSGKRVHQMGFTLDDGRDWVATHHQGDTYVQISEADPNKWPNDFTLPRKGASGDFGTSVREKLGAAHCDTLTDAEFKSMVRWWADILNTEFAEAEAARAAEEAQDEEDAE